MNTKFSRRHYVALAQWLAETRQPPEVVGTIALSLANQLAADNPRFDQDRFLKAAGVNENAPAYAREAAE